MGGKGKWRLQVCVCVFIFLMWEDNIKDKIQVSKPLVMRVEIQSYNSLFDSCFSPGPNSCCVLLELALSDLLCLHIHSTVTKRRERLRLVSGASMQNVSVWESESAHPGVSLSLEMLKRNVASSESSDRVGEDSFNAGKRGRLSHWSFSTYTLSTPVSFSQSSSLMCIDRLVLT